MRTNRKEKIKKEEEKGRRTEANAKALAVRCLLEAKAADGGEPAEPSEGTATAPVKALAGDKGVPDADCPKAEVDGMPADASCTARLFLRSTEKMVLFVCLNTLERKTRGMESSAILQ